MANGNAPLTIRLGLPLAAAVALVHAALLAPIPGAAATATEPAQPVTVAFIGDQGIGPGARAVLEMIKAEHADLVVDQGDLGYGHDPGAWDAMVTDVLGADFPYFAAVGNHDVAAWRGRNGYQAKLRARLARTPEARCSGDLGVMSSCTYKGLFFVLSGIGTLPPDSPDDPLRVAYLRHEPRFQELETFSLRGFPRPADDPHAGESPLSDPVHAVWGRRAG